MKSILYLSRSILVVFLLSQTTLNNLWSQTLSSDDHLLAHFEFNGNFTDSSPNNLSLESDRNSYGHDRFGNEAYALHFLPPSRGALHQLLVPSAEGKIPMTISFWANPFNWMAELRELPPLMDIMNFSQEGNNPGMDKDDFWLQFAFDTSNKTQTLVYNGRTHVANIETELQEDTWRHYTIVFGQDSDFAYNNIQFYVDGESAAVTSSENWNDQEYDLGAYRFNIGRSFVDSASAYIGQFDELRIYNAALSAEEIKNIHQFEKTNDTIANALPRSAVLEPVVIDGILRDFNILDSGDGYVEPPEIYIVGKPDAGSGYSVRLRNGQVLKISGKPEGGDIRFGRRTRVIIGSAPFDPKLSVSTNQEGGIQLGMRIRVRTAYQLYSSMDLKQWEPHSDPINSFDEAVIMDIDAGGVGRYFQLREIE